MHLFINVIKMANITLKELSKILNVSVSTISKALNDSSEISDATKKRVKEAAQMYKYQPNKMALHLKSGKTYTIGVIIPSIKNNFFTDVLSGIESVLEKEKYNVIISITNESNKKEQEQIATLTNGLTDGLILAVAEGTQIEEYFDHITQASKPIVMFDRVLSSAKQHTIVGDDFKAVYTATHYLLAKGLKNIALVSTIHNLSVGKQRAKGFQQAVIEKLGPKAPINIITAQPMAIETVIEAYINTNKVQAFVTMDEQSSIAVLRVLKNKQVAIPKEISIIGYANEVLANNVSPQFTTINQHGFDMGVQAAQTILGILSGHKQEVIKQTVSSSIVHRGTT